MLPQEQKLAVWGEFQESYISYGEDVNSVERLERTTTENAIYFVQSASMLCFDLQNSLVILLVQMLVLLYDPRRMDCYHLFWQRNIVPCCIFYTAGFDSIYLSIYLVQNSVMDSVGEIAPISFLLKECQEIHEYLPC